LKSGKYLISRKKPNNDTLAKNGAAKAFLMSILARSFEFRPRWAPM